MSKVILDNQSLIDIGNAIREINGGTLPYKPREMSSAIDALPELSLDTHAYRVTINQSPHQTITVRKWLDENEVYYNGSFTLGEKFYKVKAFIEADSGYTAGTLNKPDEFVLDRDVIIEATPATEVNHDQGIS